MVEVMASPRRMAVRRLLGTVQGWGEAAARRGFSPGRLRQAGLVAALLSGAALTSGLLAAPAHADTPWNTAVTTDTTWTTGGSPYIVSGEISVSPNVTLTIDPGVTVRFNADGGFNVQGNGAIVAIGNVGQPIVFTTNTGATRWRNFFVDGRISLRYCTIENTGDAGYRPTIWARGAGPHTIRDCTLNNGLSTGIRIEGQDQTITIENVTISAHQDHAILVTNLQQNRTLANITLTGNTKNWAYFSGGDLQQPVSVGSAQFNGAPLLFGYRASIFGSGVLTLTPGTTIKFDGNQGFYPSNGGRISAIGTPANPITFTSAATSPVPGNWDALFLNSGPTSRVDVAYCLIEYAGSGAAGAFGLWDGFGSIDHCTFQKNKRAGIGASYNTQIVASNSVISGNISNGIETDRSAVITGTNLTILNNTGEAVSHRSTRWSSLSGLTLAGNGVDAVVVGRGQFNPNTVDGTVTLDSSAIGYRPYRVLDALVWRNGVVTISPGTTLQFATGAGITVNPTTTVTAIGSPGLPITFTSVATTPAAGNWNGLTFRNGSSGALEHCTIEYAGRSSQPAVVVETSNVSIRNCTIQRNLADALRLGMAGISPKIHSTQVLNNGGAAIRQTTATMTPDYFDLYFAGNNPNALVIPGFDLGFLTVGKSVQTTLASGRTAYYRIDGATNQDVLITVDYSTPGMGSAAARFGALPDKALLVANATSVTDSRQYIVVPGRVGGSYFVNLLGLLPAGSGKPVTISARTIGAEVADASPRSAGNAGQTTFSIIGARLSPTATVSLDGPGGTRTATAVFPKDSTLLHASIDLTGLAPGDYRLTIAGLSGSAPVQVVVGAVPEFDVGFTLPGIMRVGRQVPLDITYRNIGTTDSRLPLLTLTAPPGSLFRVLANSSDGSSEMLILAPPVIAGLPMLPAGAGGTVRVYYTAPTTPGRLKLEVLANTIDDPAFAAQRIDWDAMQANDIPPGSTPEAWAKHLADERSRYGDTYASLYAFLASQIIEERIDSSTVFINGEWFMRSATTPTALVPRPSLPTPPTLPNSAFSLGDGNGALRTPQETAPGDGVQQVFVVTVGNPNSDTANLPGAQNDADNVSRFFKTTYNVPSANVKKLIGANQATVANVRNAINDAVRRADADDKIVFWNSGHGSLQWDANREYVAHYADGGIRSEQFDILFRQTTTPIFAVFDTCHSGATRSQITSPNVFSVGAAQWREVASDGAGGTPQGAATQQLLQALNANPHGTLNQVVQTASSGVVANDQTLSWIQAAQPLTVTRQTQAAINRINGRMQSTNPSDFSVIPQGNAGMDKWFADQKSDLLANISGLSETLADQIIQQYRNDYLGSDYSPGTTVVDSSNNPLYQVPNGIGQHPVTNVRGQSGLKLERQDVKRPASSQVNRNQRSTRGQGRQRVRQQELDVRTSFDPNEKIGPAGIGPRHGIDAVSLVPYTVFFENDPKKATLPAATVVITDRLPATLDWNTFQFTEFAFGSHAVLAPPGLTTFSADVDLRPDGLNLIVAITAWLDPQTGIVTVRFVSLDPTTRDEPADPAAGFLPPNDDSKRGEGHFGFTVRTAPGLVIGDSIANFATIVFDVNPPLVTNTYVNRIGEEYLTNLPVTYRAESGN
ncbi:MAG: caspase family protein [Dehalococcoidia bacterium]